MCPDPEKHKENARLYVEYNEDTYFEIIQLLSPKVLAYVSLNLPTANRFNGYKLWQLLKMKYMGDDLTSKTNALKKFLAVEYDLLPFFLANFCSANQKITLSCLPIDYQVENSHSQQAPVTVSFFQEQNMDEL